MPTYKKPKAKRIVYEVSWDDLEPSHEEDLFVLLRSAFLGYEFALALNETLEIGLERQYEDLDINFGANRIRSCAHYTYYDEADMLDYHLICPPPDYGGFIPDLRIYDKLLYIQGQNARQQSGKLQKLFSPIPLRLQLSGASGTSPLSHYIEESYILDFVEYEDLNPALFYGVNGRDTRIANVKTALQAFIDTLDQQKSADRFQLVESLTENSFSP